MIWIFQISEACSATEVYLLHSLKWQCFISGVGLLYQLLQVRQKLQEKNGSEYNQDLIHIGFYRGTITIVSGILLMTSDFIKQGYDVGTIECLYGDILDQFSFWVTFKKSIQRKISSSSGKSLGREWSWEGFLNPVKNIIDT